MEEMKEDQPGFIQKIVLPLPNPPSSGMGEGTWAYN